MSTSTTSQLKMSRYLLAIIAGAVALVILFVGLRAVRISRRQQAVASPVEQTTTTVPFFIADGTGHAGYQPGDQELAQWALQAWQNIVGNSVHFEAGPEASSIVRLYWADPEGGQFGEMSPIAVGGLRGAAVFIRPDMEALGPKLAKRAQDDPLMRDSIVYLTCLHELGHALGLSHSQDFSDIMYYFGYGGNIVDYFERYRAQIKSRSDIQSVSGLSENDVNRIKRLYGQQ